MPESPIGGSPTPKASPAGRRRALIILIAGLALLAAFLLVTKVAMAPPSKTSPATTVPVTHGPVRSVAAAASAAAKKLDSGTATDSSQTTTTAVTAATATVAPGTAGDNSGPKPDTVRNPFQP